MVLEHKIESFLGKIKLGVDFFLDAGIQLVQMIDEDPRVFDEIVEQAREPWITEDVLRVFESIGRKQLAVEAMFMPRHVLNRLIALPLDQQASISTSPVPVVTGFRQGQHRVAYKSASKLTMKEAATVIGPNGIRPPEEQAKELILPSHKEESIGRYTVLIMNNKPFIKHSNAKGICTKVLVTDEMAIEIDLVRIVPVH